MNFTIQQQRICLRKVKIGERTGPAQFFSITRLKRKNMMCFHLFWSERNEHVEPRLLLNVLKGYFIHRKPHDETIGEGK